jgi:hypothetical protein
VVLRTTPGEMPRKEIDADESAAIMTIPHRLDEMQRACSPARGAARANSHRGVSRLRALREIVEGRGGFVYRRLVRRRGLRGEGEGGDEGDDPRAAAEEFRTPDAPARCAVCGAVLRRRRPCGPGRTEAALSDLFQYRDGTCTARGSRRRSSSPSTARRSTSTASARSASASARSPARSRALDPLIAYSVKANGNLGVLRCSAAAGARAPTS